MLVNLPYVVVGIVIFLCDTLAVITYLVEVFDADKGETTTIIISETEP